MPGLLRGVARTAVVAGTASAVSGRVQRRQAEKYAGRDANIAAQRTQAYQQDMGYQQPQQAPQYQQAPPPPPPPPAAPAPDRFAQLKELGELKAQGILTEAEFESEKAKVLAS